MLFYSTQQLLYNYENPIKYIRVLKNKSREREREREKERD